MSDKAFAHVWIVLLLAAVAAMVLSALAEAQQPAGHMPFPALATDPVLIAPGTARWLGVISHGVLAFLVGFAVWRGCGRASAGGLVALLCAFSPTLIRVCANPGPEPVFLCVALAAMLSLARWLRGGQALWVAVAALLAGLACLQHVAGYALIAAGVFSMLVVNRRRAAWFAAGYAILALLLQGVLLARGTAMVAWDNAGLSARHAETAVLVVAGWFMPDALPLPLKYAAATLALVSLLVLGTRTLRQRPAPVATLLCVAFGVAGSLLAAVQAAVGAADAAQFERLLSPLWVCTIVGLGLLSGQMAEHRGAAVRTALAVLLLSFIPRAVGTVAEQQPTDAGQHQEQHQEQHQAE